MENLTVRKLNELDEDIYDEFIFEHIACNQEYLADNFYRTHKKFIEFKNFKDWYNKTKDNTSIYLVFSVFT